MTFEKIKYFVFVFALLSLCLLLFSIYFFSPKVFSVTDFLVSDTSKVVTLYGTIREIDNTNTTYFFNLCDGSKCVECIFFNPSSSQKDLLINNTSIKITGKKEDKFFVYKIEKG